jgi:hypothetical protein
VSNDASQHPRSADQSRAASEDKSSNRHADARTTAVDRSVTGDRAADRTSKGASTRASDLARYLASPKQDADTAQRRDFAAVDGRTATGSPLGRGLPDGTGHGDNPSHGDARAVASSDRTRQEQFNAYLASPREGTQPAQQAPFTVVAPAGPDLRSQLGAHGISIDTPVPRDGQQPAAQQASPGLPTPRSDLGSPHTARDVHGDRDVRADRGHEQPAVDVGFGPPGPTDKRAALAGSPVYDLQTRLEGAGLTQDQIDGFRQRLLTDPALLSALTDGLADRERRELLLDFAEVSQQDWKRYIPAPVRIDAMMHQALGRAPGGYLSQRDLDKLTQVAGFEQAELRARGLSQHDITAVQHYLAQTGRLPHSIEADPLSMTRDGRIMPATAATVHERELYIKAAHESPVVFETVRSATGDVEKAEAAGELAKLVVEAAEAMHEHHTRSEPAVVRSNLDRR